MKTHVYGQYGCLRILTARSGRKMYDEMICLTIPGRQDVNPKTAKMYSVLNIIE